METNSLSADKALAVRRLDELGCSCVVVRGGVERHFCSRGVADLFDMVESGDDILRSAAVADKVVGKGAAALMILGGVAAIHTPVISAPALSMLSKAGVDVTFGECVDGIINRAGSGPCPVEEMCRRCATPQECLPLIRGFVERMRDNHQSGKQK